MVVLRQAEPADADAVAALTRRAYAQWVPVIGREPLPMVADHARAIRDHRVDLLEEAGVLLALMHSVLRSGDLLVENLAVDPGQQGRGLGQRLLAHAEALARVAGRPTLRLYTNGAFAANLRFYAARGFRLEKEEPFRGGTTVHFVKAVPAA